MRVLLLFLLVLHGLFHGWVGARETSDEDLAEGFALAVQNLEKRSQSLGDARMSFTQSIEDNKGNRVVRKFDPLGEESPWMVLSIEGEDLTQMEVQWSVPVQLDPQTFASLSPSLCEETETEWVYCTASPISVEVNGEQDGETSGDMLQEYLGTRITVNKASQRFSGMSIFNKEVFRPSPLAKVERFEVQLEFEPAWQDGPLVTHTASRRLEGTYGLFISIDEHLTQTMSAFAPVDIRAN